MRSAEITAGRRFVLVLDPGEEVVAAVTAWAREHDVSSATVDAFFGAFRDITIIASRDPIEDPEPPLPARVRVEYLEGIGSGSIAQAADGTRVHLHIAAGAKAEGGLAYAGHLLSAQVHYTVEIVVQEILAPAFVLQEDPAAFGLTSLRFRRD